MPRDTKIRNPAGWGLTILAGLIFALVGLLAGGTSIQLLWRTLDSRSWQKVPATLLSAELVTHTDVDSTTYSVEARYRYLFGGTIFEGNRVSFLEHSDDLGSFHQDAANTLKDHLEKGETIPCYVDPDNPREAVIFRQFRWRHMSFLGLFGLLFGGVGLVTLLALSIAWRKRTGRGYLDKKYLEPWKWRRTNGIWGWKKELSKEEESTQGPNGTEVAFSGLIALFWNLMSSFVWFVVPQKVLEEGRYLLLLLLIFPLIGLGFVVWVVRLFLSWRRSAN
ncbi:MAG: DUF3592 domain-containing protein [Deltaproteobacteria bacterium]|nr:DUF3592 domain-containing protein [Deltaproteobacteria bacterium]